MIITKHIEKRTITLEELVKQKEHKDYAKWRRLGKGENFLLIFGGSPKVFYNEVLETNWTHEEVRAFIKQEKLYKLRERVEEIYKRDSGTVIDYLTVATQMINTFFENYKGLKERIERNREFVKENGYLRSIHGATRVIPELYLQGAYDKKEHSLMLRNLSNIAANADIQNLESCIINQAMVRVEKIFDESTLDVEMFNNIHDSADFYVLKTDLDKFAKIVKDEFTRDFPEYESIPLPVDFNVVDKMKGENYKHGSNYYV